jgi:hypothetical protein
MLRSEAEQHHGRVQEEGVTEMSTYEPQHWEHDGEIADPPPDGDGGGRNNGDTGDADDAEEPGEPVALEDDRELLGDGRRLEVLLGRSPGHVVGSDVGSEGSHDVEGEAGEEDDTHRDVAEAFIEGVAEGGGLGTVAGRDDGDRSSGGEDGDDGEEDAERGEEGERHLGSPVEEERAVRKEGEGGEGGKRGKRRSARALFRSRQTARKRTRSLEGGT